MNDARLGGALYLVVDLVLVVALALVLAYWTWQLMSPRVAAAPSFSAAPVAADVAALARQHLFGSGGEKSAGTGASGVRLLGVVAPGRALIAIGGERARAYAPGESLSDGTTLKEVHADHVLISRDGVLERVTLDRRVARGASQPGAHVRR